jgi:Domain of unknown function (DUF4112)
MLLNNLVSATVGFVPFAGDILLAQFKANWRNAALLEEFLRIRGETYLEMKEQKMKEGKAIVTPTPNDAEKGKDKSVKEAAKKENETVISDPASGSQAPVAEIRENSDVEQIKPGAGLKEGEVIPDNGAVAGDEPVAGEPTPIASTSLNESTPASGSALNESAPSNKPTPKDPTVNTKRKLSFAGWRLMGKGPPPENRGKFVENLAAGSDENSQEASTSVT